MTLHDIINDFEMEFAALVARFRSHPVVQAAAAATPAPSPTTPATPVVGLPAGQDHVDPHPSFDWAPYAGQTDRAAFFAFATRMGRPPSDTEQAAAYAVGVVKTEVTPLPPQPDRTTPSDLGWSNGQWLYDTAAVKSYTVTPPEGWTGYLSIQSQYTGAASPAFVSYTINGVSHEFMGTFQQWTTNDADFPKVTGPFTVEVRELDAHHQPASGYAVQIQLNHTP